MKKKIAIITGVTGQDGSYLSEFLLKKNYIVHGIKRRSSSINTERLDHLFEEVFKKNKNFILHYGDMSDYISLSKIINSVKPDEIYNLAAQSHVGVSFEMPEYTSNTDALGTLRILEVIKNLGTKKIKLYQASTSELYGNTNSNFQNEKTVFKPVSPYATAKLYAHWIVKNYRDSYGIYASNGILFNHESPRRGETFVSRKITIGLSKIKLGLQNVLYLGNLDSMRDWGHAADYVEAMWNILQQKLPDDYVIATGKAYSVRNFVEEAAKNLGFKIVWKYSGLNEIGIDKYSKKLLVKVHKKYFRPNEVHYLRGDSTKAFKTFKWKAKIGFKLLVEEMINSDFKKIKSSIAK
jgi:GDPmannose 4,6-dehydratase